MILFFVWVAFICLSIIAIPVAAALDKRKLRAEFAAAAEAGAMRAGEDQGESELGGPVEGEAEIEEAPPDVLETHSLSEPKIYFNCSSCGLGVSAPPRGAGRNTPCPKCGTSCEVPFPGKNQLRLRCGTDGTEYDLDHAGPCEVCAETDDLQRFCLRHKTICAEPCVECVRAAEQGYKERWG